MFIYKKTEELEKMTSTELDAYKSELKQHEAAELAKNVADTVKQEIDAAKEALKDFSAEEISKQLVEQLKSTEKNEMTLKQEIDSKKEEIKNIVHGQRGEVEIKALTNRASITGNTNAYELPNIGQLGVKVRALYDVLPKIQLSTSANDNGVIKYQDWDEATTVRAAAAVAEGAAFPESTAKFVESTIPIRKIGDTLPVTDEFGEDANLAAAELARFVEINVNSNIDNQLINGTGASDQMSGLLLQAPDYTPVASGITDANIYDLCRKMRTTIVKNRGSKYSPDIVVANAETIDKYLLKKDANNNYMFRLELGNNIGSLTIVEDNNMPDNQLIVGDRRFATIYEKGGVVLSEGMINAQFTSDTKTIKARKRMALLIRNVDKTGFLHCTNITTALATLATP